MDTQGRNVFEGTVYYSARMPKSNDKSKEANSNSSHSLPKHDLESLIYVMASMCDYKLPWSEELIGKELQDLEDYFAFKAQVTDDEIIGILLV